MFERVVSVTEVMFEMLFSRNEREGLATRKTLRSKRGRKSDRGLVENNNNVVTSAVLTSAV